jgi:predicted RND superfamily exporter protein
MSGFIFRYRWIIVIICGLTGVVSALVIPKISVDPEMRNYVPPFIGSRIETDKIEKQFGVQDMVMIMFSDSCIITTDNLNQIKNIHKSYQELMKMNCVPLLKVSERRANGGCDPLIEKYTVDSFELWKLGNDTKTGLPGYVISSIGHASITAN